MAQQNLPDDFDLVFVIRTDPQDPRSLPAWEFEWSLSAEICAGDQVGWSINRAVIRRFDAQGQVDAQWQDVVPNFDSSDGLWWVRHEDPLAPTPLDFTAPVALLRGIASGQQQEVDDLVYSWAASEYSGEPMYEGRVVAVDFSFVNAVTAEPEDEGDEEPTEAGGRDPNGE